AGDPPARHRLVVLGDVLVPVVAGLLRTRVTGAALGRPPQQPRHAEQVQRGQGDDVPVPAHAHACVPFLVPRPASGPLPLPLPAFLSRASCSSSTASRAVASKLFLLRGSHAQIAMAMNSSSRNRVMIPDNMAQPPRGA